MESNLLTFEALAKYQNWMHREDHFNHDSHESNLEFLEEQWKEGHRDEVNDGLCQLPSFMKGNITATM